MVFTIFTKNVYIFGLEKQEAENILNIVLYTQKVLIRKDVKNTHLQSNSFLWLKLESFLICETRALK